MGQRTPKFQPGFSAARNAVVVLIAGLMLTGCITSAPNDNRTSQRLPTPSPHTKVGNPYTIAGRTYVPRVEPDYVESGIASWYGPKFHGKLTANGELFDQARLTAAHRTLPLPSLVRVTNLENGRTAVLRVNDRGPFSGERIIDLSKKAAETLGTKEQGLGNVRVEYLGAARLSDAIVTLGAPEDYAALHVPTEDRAGSRYASAKPLAATPVRAVPAPMPVPSNVAPFSAPTQTLSANSSASPEGYFVRIGTYADVSSIRTIRERFPEQIPVHVSTGGAGAAQVHHVKLGPYTHEFAAIEAQRYARESGFADAHIVREARTQ